MRKPNTGGISNPMRISRKRSYPWDDFYGNGDPVAFFSISDSWVHPSPIPRLSKAFLLSRLPLRARLGLLHASCLLPFKVHRDRFGSR